MSFGVKLGKLATFEFNPRGNIWYKDENTFGRKILSRMGWQKGKGLGRNEDGIKENLQVTKKYDNTGVGWKNDMINSVGCTEYDNILKKLQETFNKDDKTEEKSNNSETLKKVPRRSHLYFRKFEKELSDCSEKDLKCIFIENSKELSKENVDSNDEENKKISKEEMEKTETPIFKSSLSINEYFAEKMKKKMSLASNHESKKDSKEDESLISAIECEIPNIKIENTSSICENSSVSKKSKKKRKRDLKSEELMSTLEENTTAAENEDSLISVIKCETPGIKVENTSDEIEIFSFSKKSKKKRKRDLESEELESTLKKNATAAENEDSLISAIKCDIPDVEIENTSSNSENLLVSKKSKKKRKHDLESETDENTHTKHKRKKSKKNKMSTIEKIKSCLKKKNYSFNLKRDDKKVCFNELVSYKILDGENTTDRFGVQKVNFEPKESIYVKYFKNIKPFSYFDFMDENDSVDSSSSSSDSEEEELNVKKKVVNDETKSQSEESSTDEDQKPAKNLLNNCVIYSSSDSEEEKQNVEKKVVNNETKSQSEESSTDEDQKPACMNIPKCSASNFNFWLESQRAAMKMKTYQDMFAKLKTHPVFKTTNLLDIKGYGNW